MTANIECAQYPHMHIDVINSIIIGCDVTTEYSFSNCAKTGHLVYYDDCTVHKFWFHILSESQKSSFYRYQIGD